MKKTFILLAFLSCLMGFSQGITVDATTYTPAQLVNDVLINSPCVAAQNVVASTGTNFGSTNGIGYFENLNPNFPFSRGVILTTGNVLNSPSPNNTTLSDGSNTWPGDTTLENILLSQNGVSINSINATSLTFEFTPKTPSFDFRFVFASEEYGTSQCDFSDAFAFILYNKTLDPGLTNGINLAVINGNTAVSVATIRDNEYNPLCTSENESFFGAFNGPGFGPAINYNGQTIPLTASATGLNTNHIYVIKIVIADGNDNTNFDSAIFLEANSLNVGQNVLGIDYVPANNNAICAGATLPTLNAAGLLAGTTYTWAQNGTTIAGATNSTLVLQGNPSISPLVAGENRFSVTYVEPLCTAITDEIIVFLYPTINALATVPNIHVCDTGATNYTFDLSKNTPIILSNNTAAAADDLPADTIIRYYETQAAADAGLTTNALPLSYSIPSNPNNKVIYVRIQANGTPCYVVRTFTLRIIAAPVIAATPQNITICARNSTENPPRANINLATLTTNPALNPPISYTNVVLGSQDPTAYTVTFHSTAAGASSTINNTTARLNPVNGVLASVSRIFYVRIQNASDPSCFTTTQFSLTVTPLAQVDDFPDVVVCTSYTLPPLTFAGSQYRTAANGGGTVINAGTTFTTNTTVHIWNNTGGCPGSSNFTITIANLTAITPDDETVCTSYSLPTLPYGDYYNNPNGTGTPIAEGSELTNAVNNLFVVFTDNTVSPPCVINRPFTINVIPFTPLPDYDNQFACSSYTLPPAGNGGTYYNGPNKTGGIVSPNTIINTVGVRTIYVYKESNTSPVNCTSEKSFTVTIGFSSITPPADVNSCSSYALPPPPFGEYRDAPAGGGNVITLPATLSAPLTTVYIYVPGQSCLDNLSFDVTVNVAALPTIPDVGPVCDIYTLPELGLGGQYRTAPGGTGSVRPVGFPITTPGVTTLYYYKQGAAAGCFVEEEFTVTVNQSPQISPRPQEVIRCNQPFVLDNLAFGEYYDNPGGPSASNPVLPEGFEITSDNTIYVYSSSSEPGNTCFQEYSIDVFVTNTTVTDVADVFKCDTDNYVLPAIVGPGTYYTAPNGPNGTGTALAAGFAPPVGTNTYYVYAENNNRIACSDEDSFTVTIYQTPTVAPITPVTQCDSYILPAPPAPATRWFTLPGGPTVTNNVERLPGFNVTTTTTLYAYAESGTAATQICFDDEPFVITINQTPNIPAQAAIYACDSYIVPAPPAPATKWFTDNTGTGTEITVGTTINASTTIYAYAETATVPNCFEYEPLSITIYNTPVVAPIAPVTVCDSYTLLAPPAPATRWFTLPGGPTVPGNVERLAGFNVIVTTTLYAYAESGTTATQICFDDEPFVITINNSPVVAAIAPAFACDTYILPAPPAPATRWFTQPGGPSNAANTELFAGNSISNSTTIYAYADTGTVPNCTDEEAFNITITTTPIINPADIQNINTCATSYALPNLTTPGANYYAGPNGTGGVINPGTIYTSNAQVYVYAVNGTAPNTCASANESFNITFYNVDEVPDVTVCGSYTLLPLNTPGAAYYNAPNGGGGEIPVGTVINSTRTIYVYGIAPFTPACSSETSFIVTVNPAAVANPVPQSLLRVCDSDANPNDFITGFDLDTLTATILGSQDPTFYSVEYYPSPDDADFQTNEIITDNGPLTDTSLNTVYVRVSDGSTSGCEDIEPVTITVIPQPASDPLSGTICTDVVTGQITLPVIESGYSSSFYNFNWTNAAGDTVATTPNFSPTAAGAYQLVITAQGITGCESTPIPVTVIESARPAEVSFETLGWFTNSQTIRVLTNPADDGTKFLYSIDGQPAQSSNVFTNVPSGVHEIVVSDVNGCGSLPLPITIELVDSMKYFTPNGDGINDRWTIKGFDPSNPAQVFIYDRFGRFLTQIYTDGDGWDGTVAGQPLPGTDYWFTIQYVENGVLKEYKSHFSLIR
ncbi:T9SS type B sorting domain-containing protein [Flavobacterium sp.]|uniref:T9SS type B sorting domain-containing protein n=1 Tax=Flavobacterium sp. TaxID=239 RepID=UPI00260349B7|nr:T9SS type B sorting domain-containing protein [Flavobacterium sp.]